MRYKTVNGNIVCVDKIGSISYNISVYDNIDDYYINLGVVPKDKIQLFIEIFGLQET